jgi:putative DNA primase/helicase
MVRRVQRWALPYFTFARRRRRARVTDSMIPVPVDDPLELAWYECNDFGNGRRLAVLAGGLLKWVDDKAWLAFDGRRWSEREGQFRARALAHEVAQHCNTEAVALGELLGDPDRPDVQALQARYGAWCSPEIATDRLKLLRTHAIKSGNAAQTDAMLKQARDMAEMRSWSEEFDVDPLTYNCANGTLRFRLLDPAAVPKDAPRGPVLAGGRCWAMLFQEGHEPGDRLRQIAEWAYDPKAACPMWVDRLALVHPDAEQRGVLARMYGQTLTGLTDSEEFYVHKGRGGDGKTKTHEILAHGHGDYYRDTSVKTFLQASFQKSGAEHRSDLVRLSGDIRMIVAPEPPPGSTWDGEVLKTVTGGGMVTARGSGAATEITFKPRWKLFVEVNPTPRMPGDDKGFRRRFRLVQWLVDLNLIEGGFESPAALRDRLWSESSGVLNWLIAGALDWLGDRRVPVPERESEALADFWATGNPLGEWIDEECDLLDRDAETGSTVLWNAFKGWMERSEVEEEARKKWNPTRFGRELGQRQLVGKKDRRGNKVRRGIKLRAADGLLGNPGAFSANAPAVSAKPTAPDLNGDVDPFGGDW